MKIRSKFFVALICLIFGGAFSFADEIDKIKANAERGDAKAQAALGRSYLKGEGVIKDTAEALTWFRKAAEQGDASAQFSLGNCYSNGWGVRPSNREAVAWYRMSAERGDALGQGALGISYLFGLGLDIDFVQAHAWLNLASASGYTEARNFLPKLESEMTDQQITMATNLARELVAKIKTAKDTKK